VSEIWHPTCSGRTDIGPAYNRDTQITHIQAQTRSYDVVDYRFCPQNVNWGEEFKLEQQAEYSYLAVDRRANLEWNIVCAQVVQGKGGTCMSCTAATADPCYGDSPSQLGFRLQ
jgi:hypothetical protein